MPTIIARILASLAVIILSPAILTILAITSVAYADPPDTAYALIIATGIIIPFASVGWLLIWRSYITWSPNRKSYTLGIGLGMLFVATIVGFAICENSLVPEKIALAITFAGMVWLLGWCVFTPLVWKETAEECAQRRQEITDGWPS